MNVVKNLIVNYIKSRKYRENELIWARNWDDTKKSLLWIQDMPGISPGRWAVGYNYLYVMTRVLDEINPKSVLDLGLGISSTLISAYMRSVSDSAKHIIVEHNSDWVEFYTSKHSMSDSSEIVTLPCTEKKYKGKKYMAYEGFSDKIIGNTFSVISVDGPLGGDVYSRRDILDVLPQVLEKSFVIIFDDAERFGERKTIKDVKQTLKNSGIAYCCNIYRGMKDVYVITSTDYSFLCSL